MFKTLLKVLILLLSLGITSQAYSAWLANQMYTISTDVEILGPVQTTSNRKEHQSAIFRIILEEAHELGKNYLEVGDHEAYWAFIMASLIVPYHEGANIHFRKTDNQNQACRTRSNSGDILSFSNNYYGSFKRLFKDEQSPYLPDCYFFNHKPKVHQLLHGADGSDIGIMQVNIYWHERDYFATGYWKNVRGSVQYGLSIIHRGFNSVYRRSDRYDCVVNSDGSINYNNLIRSSWAGLYNSGNLGASCRFKDKNHLFANNDINFKNALDKMISFEQMESIQRYYPMNTTEQEVLQKIVMAHNKSKTDTDFLQSYLSQNSSLPIDKSHKLLSIDDTENNQKENLQTEVINNANSSSHQGDKKSNEQQKTDQKIKPEKDVEKLIQYKVTAAALNFRQGPSVQNNRCGVLPNSQEIISIKKTGNWIQIKRTEEIKRYESFLGDCQKQERFVHQNHVKKIGEIQSTTEQDKGLTKNSTKENKKVVTEWLNVREDRPHGYNVAPPTGNVVAPEMEIIIEDKIFNSSNSKFPWYEISSPYRGWVYGEFVKTKK